MTMLAEHVDGVIGVDTHRDTLAAAAVSPIGAILETTDAPAHGRGYQRLLDFARSHVPGRRCWALEGTGSFGAGLAAFLEDAGERVIEVCRPKRPPVHGGRKTDMLDAIRAAREALATEHVIQPRKRGERGGIVDTFSCTAVNSKTGSGSTKPSSPWHVVVQELDSPAHTLHEMTFSDWLLAYLRGEDVTVCSRNFAPDRPFWEFLP